MVISIFCLSAMGVDLGLPPGNGEADRAVRLDLFLVEGEALLGHFGLHLVLGVALEEPVRQRRQLLVRVLLDAGPVRDQLVRAFLAEPEPDVVALRRLDLRLRRERGSLPAAHLHQLVLRGLLELQAQLLERGVERDEIVDLRLHLREVAQADLPPTSISIFRPASAPPSPCQIEEACRARVLHQVRSAAIFSFIVRESGTVSCSECSTPSVVSTPDLPARSYSSNSAETMACSISAPVIPSPFSAIRSRLNWPGSRPRRLRWIEAISRRSGSVGRSTKKISSKRPLRIISGA